MSQKIKIIIFFIASLILLQALNVFVFYLNKPFFCANIHNGQNIGNILQEQEEQKQNINEEEVENIAGKIGDIELKSNQTKEQALAEINPSALLNPVIPPEVSLPLNVFNTQGKIISIEEGLIIAQGNGSNFEDQLPRQLKVKVDEKTIVFEKGGLKKYIGLQGLDYLSVGGNISLSSAGNIRGKTEFTADYINKN